MPEVKREPLYIQNPKDEWELLTCFDESHTLSDISRWLMTNRTEAEEVHRILGEMLND